MWNDNFDDNVHRWADNYQNPDQREVYLKTTILRKPIAGIVSGYHELPYILIAPDEDNSSHSIEVNGKISVSPRFVISPGMLEETFGEVFDEETFDNQLQGRLFSFANVRKKNLKVQSEYFQMKNIDEHPEKYADKVQDRLMSQENIKSALIFGPVFKYYPISLDRFITEIIEREFRA
ncbi:MAG: hypothetical protein GF401_01415 [Chitinivibrionales bacterium]|nr:hypothetical protein [Chitinivibrionales bacterium]